MLAALLIPTTKDLAQELFRKAVDLLYTIVVTIFLSIGITRTVSNLVKDRTCLKYITINPHEHHTIYATFS